jgi:DNA primase
MPHPAARAVSILTTATALGLKVDGRRAHCFNAMAHKGGADVDPSLTFFTDSNRFHCFSCGVKGDVIDLVKAIMRCDFKTAVAWVQTYGGRQPSDYKTATSATIRRARTPDKDAQEIFNVFHANTYEISPESLAGEFLRQRGLDFAVANMHHVADLNDAREVFGLLKDQFSLDRLQAAGLLSRSGNFLFARHRLLLFYRYDDSLVYVQARDIDGRSNCKELSLAGLHSPVPYNADLLRTPQEEIYICEGCIDTLSAVQFEVLTI